MSINNTNTSYLSSTRVLRLLSLLLLCLSLHSCALAKGKKAKKKGVVHAMTVAAIRPENKGDAFVRVSFLQSARFYKLPNNANPEYMILLKESLSTHTPVLVERAKEESDVIVSVTKQK
ncbi:MAG: hypothetical protein JWQ38_1932 [Flavipsychrobacter sp.]|nr:hypothetical protein [Flavipsychrobacter sp.]